jgi:hypothetical protein
MASASSTVFAQPLRNIWPMLTALTVTNGLDAPVVDRGVGCVARARTDPHSADSLVSYVGQRGQIIDDGADVLGTDMRVFQLPRLTRALALMQATGCELSLRDCTPAAPDRTRAC